MEDQRLVFDPKARAWRQRKASPGFRLTDDALEDEFAALDTLRRYAGACGKKLILRMVD